jgi:hypothetical protein
LWARHWRVFDLSLFDTSNVVESLWKVVKFCVFFGRRNLSGITLLDRLVGVPGCASEASALAMQHFSQWCCGM